MVEGEVSPLSLWSGCRAGGPFTCFCTSFLAGTAARTSVQDHAALHGGPEQVASVAAGPAPFHPSPTPEHTPATFQKGGIAGEQCSLLGMHNWGAMAPPQRWR